MTERDKPRSEAEVRPSSVTALSRDDEVARPGGRNDEAPRASGREDDVERALGRAVALGLPIASIITAAAVGAVAGVGAALLVLAAGALLGAIGLFWASVRTLSGDAPLPTSFETLSADRHGVDALGEEKLRLLRALKDLENEHELGKINDADYQALLADYRGQAKAVLRSMEVEVAPFREEAERLARDYLKKRSVSPPAEKRAGAARSPMAERVMCTGCGASNETDAAFCKQCGAAMKKEEAGATR